MATDTESIILETARAHFVRNGYAATRLQEIADEAQINKAMLHYYFRSKDKLYHEVIVRTLDQVIPIFAGAIAKEGNFRERVENIVGAYINVLRDQPEIPIFVMSEIAQKRERIIIELKKKAHFFPAIQSFIAEMTAEMEAGNIRTVNPLHLFLNIIGMTVFPFIAKPVFQTILEVPNEDFDQMMKERKEVIIDFVHHALKPE